jgi:signal transduction histidine kinase/ligand-binding sensor domain-containing protein
MSCRPIREALCCALTCFGLAGPPSSAYSSIGPFQVKRWTTEQGLPQNRIACLKQTHDGYLWLGTWFGLARFDGARFTMFTTGNTPELVSDTINSLEEDETGTLWIGTKAGLVSYQDHVFRRWPLPNNVCDPEVWRLAKARSGGIWAQAGGCVARVNREAFSFVRQVEWPGNQIRQLVEGEDGGLNIFTVLGWLALSDDGTALGTNYLLTLGEPGLTAATPTGEPGTFWVGRPDGLRRLTAGGKPVLLDGAPDLQAVGFLRRDGRGRLWVVAERGGCWCWDGMNWEAVDLEPVAAHDRALSGSTKSVPGVQCLEEDLEGNIWLGTDQGLVQLQRQPVRSYTASDGLPNQSVYAVCEGTEGAIWLGTDGGLGCIRNGRVETLTGTEPEPQLGARCTWPGLNGSVLFAKPARGIFEYVGGDFVLRIPGHGSAKYGALYREAAGRLWVGLDESLEAFTEHSPGHWSADGPAYPVRGVVSALQDRKGTMWFGTSGRGVARYRAGTWSCFTTTNGLSDNRVWTIHESADGGLWFGTENGLTRCKAGKFFRFTSRHGLAEPTINWILEDDAGYLWLSGLHGIHRISLVDLNRVADGKAASFQCFSLGTADGLKNPETNGGSQPAGWKARDGRLWFPTIQGVVVIDAKAVPQSEEPPPVVIEQVKADDEVVFGEGRSPEPTVHSPRQLAALRPLHSALRISAGRGQVLEFRYTATTFVAPERARFRYRLVGSDADWREETGERTVRYVNLHPGEYRFEVVAANSHNTWNLHPATLAFSLAPLLWQTKSFYVICGALVIGLVAAIQAYRLRWQHRLLKLEQERALASERARIARDLHDDLGTALTGLALELDVAGRQADQPTPTGSKPGAFADRFSKAAQRTRDLAERMREVVWTINPRCDTVSSLASFLEQQVGQFLNATGLRTRLDFPEDIPELPVGAEARHQLALSVREALTNVVRHANASEIAVSLAIVENAEGGKTVEVRVKDNGQGFRLSETEGHGLENMRTRMHQAGGSFECECAPGQGTVVTFRLPLRQKPQIGRPQSEIKT